MKGFVEPVLVGDKNSISFYACGPTVYSYAHIGNFRSFLTADLIVRTAKAVNLNVKFVSNITDVGHLTEDETADGQGQDKMQRALSSKEGESFVNIWDLARHYTNCFLEDWQTLNLTEPFVRPRASEHVTEQIEIIEKLLDSKHAYKTSKGVYFSVKSFNGYGELSGNIKEEELSGVRDIIEDSEKKDPRDFALWKLDKTHLMRWHSPFGWGFPGWHIECTAMALKYLGESTDIHSGGSDNKFPHHECEIAQSESLTGKKFVNCWIHTGYLQVNGRKMSKSLENFFTVRDLLYGGNKKNSYLFDPLAIRFALTSTRYREPFNFTNEHMQASAKLIDRVKRAYEKVNEFLTKDENGSDELGNELEKMYDEILEAMLNDLNTSVAYSLVLKGSALIMDQNNMTKKTAMVAKEWFGKVNSLLGIVFHDNGHEQKDFLDPMNEKIEQLILNRNLARQNKDFKKADEIRGELMRLGIEIKDGANGTTWNKLRVL